MATYINGNFYYGDQIKIETSVNLSPCTPIINSDHTKYGRLNIYFDARKDCIVLIDISGLNLCHKLYKNPKGVQAKSNLLFLEKWILPLEESPEKQRILDFTK